VQVRPVSAGERFDIAIVGAGIAGASLAWRLAPRCRVLLLERESLPGLHSTGRSAAMFMESYGAPQARALTRAGREFLAMPPPGFADVPLVAPRGVLYVGWRGDEGRLETMLAELSATGVAVARVDAAEALRRMPVLRADGLIGAIAEPDALDIDVNALHQGFLRGARRAGASLWTDAELGDARHDGTDWTLQLGDGRRARAGIVVDAAGAWAEAVAARCGAPALGLVPKRRSAFSFDPPAGVDGRCWPCTAAVDERWYFKPDAGQLLGSPANADPVLPHDVQPEELDIATGIARIEAATTLAIRRPRRTWAGLRTFAADGELVIGFDPQRAGFFWLAGQGGYGIQSCVGASALAASLLLGEPLPQSLIREGVDPAAMAPQRLRGGPFG
jgi:D-arginine dehydrogenase